MTASITVTQNIRRVELELRPLGIRGATGTGISDGATDGQIAVYSSALDAWIPTSGFVPIVVAAALPFPTDPTTLYLITG